METIRDHSDPSALGGRRTGRLPDTEILAKSLYILCLAVTVFLGFALSWETGFGGDEQFERETLEINLQAVQQFFSGDDPGMSGLGDFVNRYYGIGFHAPSYPVQLLIAPLFERYQGLQPRDAILAAEHVTTFLFFLFGGFCVFRILRLSAVEPGLAALFTLFFLSNPYLLGHATMNTKDAPFMVAWIICTWRLLVPCMRLAVDGETRRMDFVWLGIATALLVSIRVTGGLVAIQYAVAMAATALANRPAFRACLRPLSIGITISGVIAVLLIWLSYPSFWLHPPGIVDAVRTMSRFPLHICTQTWGTCMDSQDLPWTYIPSWLLAKMSVVGLIGLAVGCYLLARRKSDKQTALSLRILLMSPVLIIMILIAMNVVLYNELRQVLFLVAGLYPPASE